MNSAHPDQGGAVDLVDDAVRLLRSASAGTHACFLAGSLPFVLGLLYFVTDMRLSAAAAGRAGETSLLMALLYIWMKGWHSVFAARLRRGLADGTPEAGPTPSGAAAHTPARDLARRLATQAAVQPWSLFVLPAACVAMLPLGWAYDYFHGVTVTADATTARRHARYRPGENHLLLGLLLLAAVVALANVSVALVILPRLGHTLLGIETPLSRAPWLFTDATMVLLAAGLAYLIVAPVAHAAYVIRAFRAEARATGEDLVRGLRALPAAGARAVVIVALVAAGASGLARAAMPEDGAASAEVRAAASGPVLSVDDLEGALRMIRARREFLWRMPRRLPAPEEARGPVARFGVAVMETISGWTTSIGHLFGRIVDWIVERLAADTPPPGDDTPMAGWARNAPLVLGGLLALALVAALVFRWRRRSQPGEFLPAEPASRPAAEDVGSASPDEAASGEWLAKARALLESGDPRLAARAVHLAMLAILGECHVLTLERSRSNRDYLREAGRRRPDQPELLAVFRDGTGDYERVWFGRHLATADLVHGLMQTCERLRHYAQG